MSDLFSFKLSYTYIAVAGDTDAYFPQDSIDNHNNKQGGIFKKGHIREGYVISDYNGNKEIILLFLVITSLGNCLNFLNDTQASTN